MMIIFESQVIMKKKHNPGFCTTFALNNEALALILLDTINSGHIRYKSKNNASVIIVSSVKG